MTLHDTRYTIAVPLDVQTKIEHGAKQTRGKSNLTSLPNTCTVGPLRSIGAGIESPNQHRRSARHDTSCARFLMAGRSGRPSGLPRPVAWSFNPLLPGHLFERGAPGFINHRRLAMSDEHTHTPTAPYSRQHTHKWVTQIEFDPMDTISHSIRAIEGFSEIIRYTIAADIVCDTCNINAFEAIADGLEHHAVILRAQLVDAKRVHVERGH